VSPGRRLLVAIVTGVVLAGPPVTAFNLWLGHRVERNGQDELNRSAGRAIAVAESRIARAAAVLDHLAARGVDSCRSTHIDALRQATFGTTPVKELSIVASDGRTLCTDVGKEAEGRTVLSVEAAAADSPMLLETIRLGEGTDRWVRVRRPGSGGANAIAALIPAELFLPQFLPQVSTHAGSPGLHVRIVTHKGTLSAESDRKQPSPANGNDSMAATGASERYALRASVTASRQGLASQQGDLRSLGTIASGLLAILILALSVLLPRRERSNPIAEIERALEAGEFIPYYQPIVDIRSGRLRGAEVLVRWRKADGTLMPPAAFIPLAESSGLIIELTRKLMRRVSEDVGRVVGPRPHLKIGFNLTARHFADETIVEDMRRIFKKSPIRLSQIVLEMTERQPLQNFTEARRVVAALQGLGVRIAIDDVGSGHSGLSYMLKLGVDIIKIDKMFIDSVGIDRHSNTIIETLIDLAQNMRMDVIAEGVESFEQVVQLRELGIRAAQGYVFAPPLPSSAFKQLVATIDPLKRLRDRAAPEAAEEISENAA
jgi:sensor c-di-GMP phosphodiesterase-like protein